MHEVVRAKLHSRLSGSLRLPSVAGSGLPERMRTTAFAFLGLTAALGLALVAIFAQVSFPVLSPGPAPSGPLQGGAVSEAVSLERPPAPFAPPSERDAAPQGSQAGSGSDRGAGRPAAAVPSPPAPAGEPSGTGGVPSAPVPAPQSPAQQPAPSAAQPGSPAAPKPEPTPARPATPEPEPAPAPGNSQSSAAAEHASERGIEASSKTSSAAVAPEAGSEASPGNGNGKALGHDK